MAELIDGTWIVSKVEMKRFEKILKHRAVLDILNIIINKNNIEWTKENLKIFYDQYKSDFILDFPDEVFYEPLK